MTQQPALLPIPDLDGSSVAFGNIDHMPKYETLPKEFRDWHRQKPHCHAMSMWFYKGAKFDNGILTIDGVSFAPKDGVDPTKALAALTAVLGSWEPQHEHKIAACGYMLSQWFDVCSSTKSETH